MIRLGDRSSHADTPASGQRVYGVSGDRETYRKDAAGNLAVFLTTMPKQEVQIASGTATVAYHGLVELESETGTEDQLDRITGVTTEGLPAILKAKSGGHVITVARGTYLKMATATFTLTGYRRIVFEKDGETDVWVERSRSNNE